MDETHAPTEPDTAPAAGTARTRASLRILSVRFTAAEWQMLQEGARATRKPVSVLVRDLAFRNVPTEKWSTKNATLIHALGRCAMELSRLTADARARGAPGDAVRLETLLAELLARVRELAPKPPSGLSKL